jgi:hypothetical protein
MLRAWPERIGADGEDRVPAGLMLAELGADELAERLGPCRDRAGARGCDRAPEAAFQHLRTEPHPGHLVIPSLDRRTPRSPHPCKFSRPRSPVFLPRAGLLLSASRPPADGKVIEKYLKFLGLNRVRKFCGVEKGDASVCTFPRSSGDVMATRDKLYARPEANDVHVRGQRPPAMS